MCNFQMARNINELVKVSEDLLIEIFLRSSVKSLLRAKCVCKQWYILIQNPDFVVNHLEYQKNHNKGRLLLQYFKEDTQQISYALFDDETLENDTHHVIDHLQLQFCPLRMEGPINGLYCLFNREDRIVLWNPALMEFKALPLPHPHFFPHVNVFEGYTGFGIDPATHDYKLVLIRMFHTEFDLHPDRYVTVYNLTTNTWRLLNLGDFQLWEYDFFENGNSSFLNGSCHWWTSSGVVIAFDMVEESFRQILGPDLPDLETSSGSLTINNDKLALLLHWHHPVSSIDVWLMLEEGVWIMQFSITSLPRFAFEAGLWNNDGLFIAMDGFETSDVNSNFQMVLCNCNTQEMRVVGPKGRPMWFQVSVYFESLVSLGNGTKQRGKRASLNTISDFLVTYSNPYSCICMDEDEFVTEDKDEAKGRG